MIGLPSALQRALALQELRGRSEVLCDSDEQPKSTDMSEDSMGEVAILLGGDGNPSENDSGHWGQPDCVVRPRSQRRRKGCLVLGGS